VHGWLSIHKSGLGRSGKKPAHGIKEKPEHDRCRHKNSKVGPDIPFSGSQNPNKVIKNYFITAFRNYWKNKTASAINLFGLTIGLTSCLLIGLYIKHEWSYDSFQTKSHRIARVIMEYSFSGGSESKKGNFTSTRVAKVFKTQFPEVESAVKMVKYDQVVESGRKLFSEKNFMYADESFFDFFSFDWLQGDMRRALSATHEIVLTQSTAKRYFGSEDPIGKTLRLTTDSIPYLVTGLMRDCPSNSQIKFDLLASFSSLGLGPEYEQSYWDANYTTYLLLQDEKSFSSLQAKIPAFMSKEMAGQGASIQFYLEPFSTVHLRSPFGGFEPNGSITYLYILGAVGLLIMVIACFTYINLSTSRSIDRAREVGVRKVIGASRSQLVWQFMMESFLSFLSATALSILLAALVMPYFNQLTGKQLSVESLLSFSFLLTSLLVGIFVSAVAGTYPALVLSDFRPVKVLKGRFVHAGPGQWVSKSLMVFQFCISVFLIVSTITVHRQLSYIQHKDLGYDRDHVLVLPMNLDMLPRLDLIKNQFKSDPDVRSVSRCVRSPVEGGGGYNMRSSLMNDNQQIAVSANPVDEDYVRTTGLQIIAGSDFSPQDIKDVSAADQKQRIYHFILNESAANQLGWSPKEAIGKKMFMGDNRPGYVKGVVKDFHFESMHELIKPFILFPELRARELLVKISGQHLARTLAGLQDKWKSLFPDQPFEYRFLDQDYNNLYQGEIRLGQMMDIFAGLAIVLACLGLLGMSSYQTQQRVKEIGIRKILGASVTSLVRTLSKDFFGLAGLAILIACPLAWWATSNWLSGFYYRIPVEGSVFALAAIMTLILTAGTIGIHTIRAAWSSPVKALRSE
jgi:putative ABC transport system permease protein